jgi:hypothetical protein
MSCSSDASWRIFIAEAAFCASTTTSSCPISFSTSATRAACVAASASAAEAAASAAAARLTAWAAVCRWWSSCSLAADSCAFSSTTCSTAQTAASHAHSVHAKHDIVDLTQCHLEPLGYLLYTDIHVEAVNAAACQIHEPLRTTC